MAIAKAKAVAVAVAKAHGVCPKRKVLKRKRRRLKVDRFAALRAFLRNLIGEQIEVGTIGGVVVGTLTDVEVNFIKLVDNAGNIVLIPLANIVFVERV